LTDIFVSYTSCDWVALELEKHVHEWEITALDDIYERMERRHAPFSTLERNGALD
jgi:hypothetical protein